MDDPDFDWEELRREARKSIALPIMFFKSVVARLDQSINKINTELRAQHAAAGEAQKQIIRLTFGLGKRIELGYGQSQICTVALTADNSHIEAVITNEPERPGSPAEKLLAFLLKCDEIEDKLKWREPGGFTKHAETAVKAYKVDLEPLPYRIHEVGAQEIVEAILGGIVRGHFD